MTKTGRDRQRYAAEVEVNPSRFDVTRYAEWARRADAWALENPHWSDSV